MDHRLVVRRLTWMVDARVVCVRDYVEVYSTILALLEGSPLLRWLSLHRHKQVTARKLSRNLILAADVGEEQSKLC